MIPDLFPLHATGVSTEPVRAAGEAFLASLTETQRQTALFPVDDDAWRLWSNVDGYQRQGMSLREMSDDQREAAFALMAASLRAEGFPTSRTIMLPNHTQGELQRCAKKLGRRESPRVSSAVERSRRECR